MKTPLTYYGGKQQLASKIVSLIPEHRIYCEPFIGGAAVFLQSLNHSLKSSTISILKSLIFMKS